MKIAPINYANNIYRFNKMSFKARKIYNEGNYKEDPIYQLYEEVGAGFIYEDALGYKKMYPFLDDDEYEPQYMRDLSEYNLTLDSFDWIKKEKERIENVTLKTVGEYGVSNELDLIVYKRRKIEEVKEMLKMINEVLDSSSVKYYEQDQRILRDMSIRISRLKGKGFQRIVGYDNIKKKLNREFVFGTIGRAKTSQEAEVKVPDALLLYGPTGCGKTTFATALAEQTLSNIIDIEVDDPIVTFNSLKEAMEESQKKYIESGDNKQRTIIIFNECEYLFSKKSPVLKELKELIKDCSNKYHCTLFMTSNKPLKMDEEILSDKYTPVKIAVPPIDRNTLRELIAKQLKVNGVPLNTVNIEAIIDASKTERGQYTAAQIMQSIINENTSEKEQLSEKDYIGRLHQIVPGYREKEKNEFEKAKEYLENM